jgi:hypothetical protein
MGAVVGVASMASLIAASAAPVRQEPVLWAPTPASTSARQDGFRRVTLCIVTDISIVECGQHPFGVPHLLFRTFDALAEYRSPSPLPMQPLSAGGTACCRIASTSGLKDRAARCAADAFEPSHSCGHRL